MDSTGRQMQQFRADVMQVIPRVGRCEGILSDLAREGCTTRQSFLTKSTQEVLSYGFSLPELNNLREIFGVRRLVNEHDSGEDEKAQEAGIAVKAARWNAGDPILPFLRTKDLACYYEQFSQSGFSTLELLSNCTYSDLDRMAFDSRDVKYASLKNAIFTLRKEFDLQEEHQRQHQQQDRRRPPVVACREQGTNMRETTASFLARNNFPQYTPTFTQAGINTVQDMTLVTKETLHGLVQLAHVPTLWNKILQIPR